MAIKNLANNKELSEIIKNTLGIAPKEKIDIITNKSIVDTSNSITSLHNAFNKIYAYTMNVKNIQTSEYKRLKNNKKEATMESGASSASLSGGSSIDVGNLPDIFMSLSSSIQDLNKNLDKLDMSGTSNSEVDIDRRRRRGGGRGRMRGLNLTSRGLGKAVFGLGAAGALFDVGGRVTEGQSVGQIASGVGGGLAGGVVGAKAGAMAGGAIGALFGGVGAAPGAAIGGFIGGVGGYFGGGFLGDKAYSASQSRGAQRQLETAATKVTRQGNALQRSTPLGSTSTSSRFADFMSQTIANMTAWATAQSAFRAVGDFFGSVGDFFGGGEGAGSSQNAETAMAYFMSQGWTREQAAGIVGNLQAESGRNLNPYAKRENDAGAGVHSYGIAQWNRDRWEGLQAFAQNKGTSPNDFQTQLEYVQHEFNTTKRNAARALRATSTPEDAASIVDQLYEVSSGEHRGRRIANARALHSGVASAGGPGRLTGFFGMRVHPLSRVRKMHRGIDIAAPTGTPVAAAYAGRVTVARRMGGYGNSVYILHPETGYVTRYAHLSSISVLEGQTVQAGDMIGAVGSTGESTGPHLHYELLDERGVHRDPITSYRRRPWIVGGLGSQFLPPAPAAITQPLTPTPRPRAQIPLPTPLRSQPSAFSVIARPESSLLGSYTGGPTFQRLQNR